MILQRATASAGHGASRAGHGPPAADGRMPRAPTCARSSASAPWRVELSPKHTLSKGLPLSMIKVEDRALGILGIPELDAVPRPSAFDAPVEPGMTALEPRGRTLGGRAEGGRFRDARSSSPARELDHRLNLSDGWSGSRFLGGNRAAQTPEMRSFRTARRMPGNDMWLMMSVSSAHRLQLSSRVHND